VIATGAVATSILIRITILTETRTSRAVTAARAASGSITRNIAVALLTAIEELPIVLVVMRARDRQAELERVDREVPEQERLDQEVEQEQRVQAVAPEQVGRAVERELLAQVAVAPEAVLVRVGDVRARSQPLARQAVAAQTKWVTAAYRRVLARARAAAASAVAAAAIAVVAVIAVEAEVVGVTLVRVVRVAVVAWEVAAVAAAVAAGAAAAGAAEGNKL
jgi:hypothetical protein